MAHLIIYPLFQYKYDIWSNFKNTKKLPELSSPEELWCVALLEFPLCMGFTYKPSAGPDLAELTEPAVEGSEPRRSWPELRLSRSGACK